MQGEDLKKLVARVAKEELGEDDHTRQQSLNILREWVLKHPSIRDCRADDSFLLRFLRHRKFSVPQAQEMLNRFISFTQMFKEDIFGDCHFLTPAVKDVINSGYLASSPYRDKYGRAIVICSIRKLDMKRHDWKSVVKACMCCMALWMENEDTQVTGITYVMDLADMDPGLCSFCPIKVVYTMTANIEKTFPLRNKNIHYINTSTAGTWLLQTMRKLLSEKLNERIYVHKSLQELHEELSPQVLPKELGGVMPLADMAELMMVDMKINHENIVAATTSRMIGKSQKLKNNFKDVGSISGSFKTLNID